MDNIRLDMLGLSNGTLTLQITRPTESVRFAQFASHVRGNWRIPYLPTNHCVQEHTVLEPSLKFTITEVYNLSVT